MNNLEDILYIVAHLILVSFMVLIYLAYQQQKQFYKFYGLHPIYHQSIIPPPRRVTSTNPHGALQ